MTAKRYPREPFHTVEGAEIRVADDGPGDDWHSAIYVSVQDERHRGRTGAWMSPREAYELGRVLQAAAMEWCDLNGGECAALWMGWRPHTNENGVETVCPLCDGSTGFER